MAKIFEKLGMQKPRMSAFDLSREQKLSCDMGDLIPTYFEEIVPGDQFRVSSEILLRMAPMVAPVMHRVNVHMHYFFVPNRLVWNQWEDFITGGKEGTSAPVYPVTPLDSDDIVANPKLADYLGLPTVPVNAETAPDISLLPFRAYQSIYNEYYRDENLTDPVNLDSQAEVVKLRKRAWEKDYFTSALPFPQRGPSIGVPVEGTGDVDYTTISKAFVSVTGDPPVTGYNDLRVSTAPQSAGNTVVKNDTTQLSDSIRIENIDQVNVTDVDFTINELRKASALQRFLEKQARGGYRYIETILSHFGVRSSDSRLQRPEYLGGGKQPVVISEVLNTTGTENAPQGDMAGHGISAGSSNSFNRTFEEHGYVIGIMSILPKTAYQQGINRTFTRFDKFDYYWPEFANLGEQEVKNKELYADFYNPDVNDETFGYQQRYAEYKYGCTTVHGDFRNSLDFWHMGRIFANQPALNADFVEANPTNRIYAVESGDHLWCQLYHRVQARRPMPYFANPSLT